MKTSSQTRSGVLPLQQSPQAHVYIDRDGDTWVGTGWTDDGDLLLACPQPITPGDAGEGESRKWTLAEVRQAFGPLTEVAAAPLMVRAEDVEEQALATVDAEFVARFGPVMASWSPKQRDTYFAAIATVHAEFVPQAVAA